jgi:transketolase
MTASSFDELCINTLRFLAVDTVEKAGSGHPGMPMGAATIAYVLWDRFLKHHPADPEWPDRDRFILSAGHASAMLYCLLHLTGYDLTMAELKRFRQWQSRTPGHIEYGLTPGVEATTGPLGQGFACGVGMAMAERWLANRYNQPDNEIVNHHTYAIVSDGDMEEGISAEAASLAGTLRLGKLIYLYDKNDISIEGSTAITFTEDVGQRFTAYHWHVVGPIDGFDIAALEGAIREAQAEKERPSLIICQTIIGYGSPNKQGTGAAHGEPLGEAEVRLAKENLGWTYPETFTVPPEVLAHFRKARERGQRSQQAWQARLEDYRRRHPDLARQFESELQGELPPGWDTDLEQVFSRDEKPMATREASGRVMNAIARKVPALIGGSADLAPSNKTTLNDAGDYHFTDYGGRNLHPGVREHAMGCISSGLSLHGGAIPFTATFLVFYDYMRPPVRLAAMMGIRVIYIFTHDSIGLGEDGPTHQPIEQIMGLRLVPNLVTLRPADATETVEAWRVAMERRNGPTALVFSRQKLPLLDRSVMAPASGTRQGGYILWEATSTPEIILIATGSEVPIALEAGRLLQKESQVSARMVSLPSWELFDAQPEEYREEVLPSSITARVSMEAGTTIGWERYVGLSGVTIGINHFGLSAPSEILYERFGFTARRMADEALGLLKRRGK